MLYGNRRELSVKTFVFHLQIPLYESFNALNASSLSETVGSVGFVTDVLQLYIYTNDGWHPLMAVSVAMYSSILSQVKHILCSTHPGINWTEDGVSVSMK